MTLRSFLPFDPNRPLSLDDLRRLFEEMERSSEITASAPLEVERLSTGYHLRLGSECYFPARLDDVKGTAYAWTEMRRQPGGTFIELSEGRSGSASGIGINPAYELNGNTNVAVPSIQWLSPGYLNVTTTGLEYLFDYCCGSTNPPAPTPSTPGCCPQGLPSSLIATFTNVSNCPCVDGEIMVLNYDASLTIWTGTRTFTECNFLVTVDFYCTGTTPGDFQMTFQNGAGVHPVTFSCSPLEIVFSFGGANPCGNPAGTGLITITL